MATYFNDQVTFLLEFYICITCRVDIYINWCFYSLMIYFQIEIQFESTSTYIMSSGGCKQYSLLKHHHVVIEKCSQFLF